MSEGAKPKTLHCEQCGKAFVHEGKGRNPKFCPEHRTGKNFKRDYDRMVKNMGQEAADKFADEAGRTTDVQRKASLNLAVLPELIAVGLAKTDDPLEAARYMGVTGATDKQILDAAEVAREKHKSLTELRATAIGKATLETIAHIIIHTKSIVPRLGPQQIGPILKTLTQVHEMMTGGGDGVYSQIVMSVGEFDGGGGEADE